MLMSYKKAITAITVFSLLLCGCGAAADSGSAAYTSYTPIDDKYRTTYEVFVYSYCDSDGDGIGDLRGLISRLDYINDGIPGSGDDLECTELWLMPVFPSPTYHKYDTTDYMAIDPEYGTLSDFDELVDECHERGVNVIIDLAINHTSTGHPWFQEALGYQLGLYDESAYADYYNFSNDRKSGYEPANGELLLDDELREELYSINSTRDMLPVYYEARFWSGMPDLNLDNESVRGEIREILAFWLEHGVDGFRLDAVTSYYTDDKSANIELLSWLSDTLRELSADAYLVGEAWVDQTDYADYYTSGVDSFFDFEFAGAEGIIARVVKGERSIDYYIDAMTAEEELYAANNPDYVNAPFYTNHDMARSAGYYAYDDGSRTKLAEGLNLMMTGNAFIYYGEELGMKGSGRDENKRAPMLWYTADEAKVAIDTAASGSAGTDGGSDDTGETSALADTLLAAGLCDGPPDMERFAMKFGSAYEQISDESSIYNYVRAAVRMRNTYPVIARGRTAAYELPADSDTVGAFTRTMPASMEAATQSGEADAPTDYEAVLIVINSGEGTATADLSSSAYQTLADSLTVAAEPVTIDGADIILPPFSIAILTR